MSTFRTLVESLIKKVYVEGLSIEESQLVTFIESCERLYLKEDVLTDKYRAWHKDFKQDINGNILPLPKIVSFTEELDKAIIEHPISGITPRIIKRGETRGDLISFYGYAVFDIPAISIAKELGVNIEDKLPVEIVYRTSDHSKPANQREGKNDDIDVQVPAKQYEKIPYAQRTMGNTSQYPYEFLFTDKKKDKKTKEYTWTYNYCPEYIGTALTMLDAAYEKRYSGYKELLNKTISGIKKAYKDKGKVSSDDIVIYIYEKNEGEYSHGSSTPLGDKWFANLENILESNINTINQYLSGTQPPAQNKAASFQQAIQKTAALDKMAQTQKALDTVVPSPDKDKER